MSVINSTLTAQDRVALARATAVNPLWNDLMSAATAFDLPANVLLHAGPPFRSVDDVTIPILNSAVVAAVYEGLARDFDQAEAMIHAGEILLKPAQDSSVVTPLAAVVSASMPLHCVVDGTVKPSEQKRTTTYAPVNGGSGPSLRLGLRSEAVLQHIRWLNTEFTAFLHKVLSRYCDGSMLGGLPLIPLAETGMLNGDDCHGRTIVGNKKMFEQLLAANGGDGVEGDFDSTEQQQIIQNFIESSPSLFLNLWMAGTKCILRQAEGVDNASFVTAAGGNGLEFGIQVSGLPNQWFCASAAAPLGALDADINMERVVGAIGDSALVEAFGLGAMAIRHAPEQLKNFEAYLPANLDERLSLLPAGSHPGFDTTGLAVGFCAGTARESGLTPLVSLGMIDRLGELGRLGGGIYPMPAKVFEDALVALQI